MAPAGVNPLAYYYSLRVASRHAVARSINRRTFSPEGREKWGNLTLASINNAALEYARLEWVKYYSPNTHMGFSYSWERLYHKFRPNPAFFDLAIWQKVDGVDTLQALALGRPSDAKENLTLNWIERSFAPTYMKGGALPVILACAEEYAKLLGSKRVLIREPIDVLTYASYGYCEYRIGDNPNRYMFKDV